MKEQLEKKMLHIIVLADDDVHWVKKEKEIWVDGKMFDIKTVYRHNGSTTFTGLFDEEETGLVKQLQANWKKKSSQDNKILAHLFNCLQNVFFSSPGDKYIALLSGKHFPGIAVPALACQYRDILTPPPQA